MADLTLAFLGPLLVTRNSSPLSGFRSQKERALLAYLAEEAEQPHQRTALISLFWPELPEQTARNNLSQTLGRLRRTVENAGAQLGDRAPDLIDATRQQIQFVMSARVQVDTHRFRTDLEPVHDKVAAAQQAQSAATSQLDAALQLYRGEFLAGLSLPGCEEFEQWLLHKRAYYQRLVVTGLERLATWYLADQHYGDAQAVAHRHLALEPWAEVAHRQLMTALALDGQRAAALAQYERCRALLRAELAIAPEAATTALFQQIQQGELEQEKGAYPIVAAGSSVAPSLTHDWHEMPILPNFFGRNEELAQLTQWLVMDRCALVAILGMGGQGKTALAAQLVPTIADRFDLVIWRSLLNAPPLEELLGTILPTLAGESGIQLPSTLDQQLALVFSHLQQRRVLVVLDNLESILQADAAGQYRPGYEAYHQLLQGVATRRHQGQFLLTSRERAQGVGRWERDTPAVRMLRLYGLDAVAGHQLLHSGDAGDPTTTSQTEAAALVERYSGNPLALKLVTQTVQELFAGDAAAFLATETAIFDDIGAVLDQQFARLSAPEQAILFWLAVERRPVTAVALHSNLVHPPPMARFISALRALQRRSLLEQVGDGFTLQNVVIEYLTERLIEGFYQDITHAIPPKIAVHAGTERPPVLRSLARSLLNQFAFCKAQAATYIRQSQKRLILQPLAQRLLTQLGKAQLASQIEQLLALLRRESLNESLNERHHHPPLPGYAGGNLLNLLLELALPASDFDFRALSLWQADLRGAYLPRLQLAGADLTGAAFTHTFRNIKGLRYRSDGALLVVGYEGELFGLWNARSGELVSRLKVDPHKFAKAFLRPDCQLVAQYNADHSIDLVAVTSDRIIQTLHGPRHLVWRISFSPNGHYVASGDSAGHVYLWRIGDGQLLAHWQAQADAVTGLAFAPDNEQIATGGLDGVVNLWQATSATLLHTLRGHTAEVAVLDFTPDGTRLITGSHDYTVRVWNVADGTPLFTLNGHSQLVRQLAIDPTGRWVATGGLDHFISLWEIASGQVYRVLADHVARSSHITFSPDGQTVAACDTNEHISVWAVASGQRLQRYQLHFAELTAVAFSPDGGWLAVGSADCAIYLWDLRAPTQPQLVTRLAGHRGLVSTVTFSPDGTIMASGDQRGEIRLWRGNDWDSRVLHSAAGNGKIAFDPAGQRVATVDDEGMRLWSVGDGRQIDRLPGAAAGARTCTFSPDGRWIVSSNGDHTVGLWEVDPVAGIRLRQTLHHHTNIVTNVLFRPDGRYLFSSSFDGTLCRWEVDTGKLDACWPTYGSYHALAMHPAGHALAAGSTDQIARLIDVESGHVTCEMHGHTRQIEAVCFAADGEMLATASFDATVRLWDVNSGRCRQTLHTPGPYAGMNISGVTGISAAQQAALQALGAVAD